MIRFLALVYAPHTHIAHMHPQQVCVFRVEWAGAVYTSIISSVSMSSGKTFRLAQWLGRGRVCINPYHQNLFGCLKMS